MEELEKVKGIGPSSAILLKLIPQLARLYMEDLHTAQDRLYDTHSISRYLMPKFIGRKNEVVILLLLDSKGRVLYCDVMNEGSIREVPIYIRSIVQKSVQYNAATAIVAHKNHPSGETMPSAGDLQATSGYFFRFRNGRSGSGGSSYCGRGRLFFNERNGLASYHIKGALKQAQGFRYF